MAKKKSVNTEIEEGVEQYYLENIKNRKELEKEKKKKTIVNNFSFKDFKPKGDNQIKMLKEIKESEIIFISGPAGTGKTFVCLKAALELIKDPEVSINKILISKPIVEAAEELGFLPGDIDMKIDPYMHSFIQNFEKLIGEENTKKLFAAGIIKSIPLAYMRGETFTNTIAILDEAQNTTLLGLKLFITRKDENSKMVIMGDIDQVDLDIKYGSKNALEDAFSRFKGINKVSFIQFDKNDIVRSKILSEILSRY